jgi:putative ABC transport system permease protein
MLYHNIRIALRNLGKNKIFSIINVTGLSVGLACFLLIATYIYDELHFDAYPTQAAHIYRIGIRLIQNGGLADYPDADVAVGAGIKNAYPEVLASTRLLPQSELYLGSGDKKFKEVHLAMCDSNFLQMFCIPLIEGDSKTALKGPFSIVVTRAFAEKYFGREPALGKTIPGFGPGLKVTGVIDKVPDRSHFHYDAFISMTTSRGATLGTTWSNIGFYTYLLLDPKADPVKLEARIQELTEKYVVSETVHDMGVSLAEARKEVGNWHFYLMPLRDIHLKSHTKYELEPNGDIQYVYIFGVLAVFILLVACVNFTNLSTASSAKRSREVGIRKVLGSVRGQLIRQFLSESFLLTFLAMLLAIGFTWLLLPAFNHISGKHIDLAPFVSLGTIAFLLGLTILVSALAGIYPAFFLSAFQTVSVLKGGGNKPARRSLLRSGLVVFQFVISTTLIIGTLIVYRQLKYMQNQRLGFDKDQVLVIHDAYALQKSQEPFRQSLLKDPRVVDASISRDAPISLDGNGFDGSEVYARENKQNESAAEIHATFFHVDYDYLKTMGMTMATGRYFSKDFADSASVVVNESAVKDLGWKNDQDAIDKTIISSGQHEFHVVGVVRDFHYTSARQKIAPLMMMLGHNFGTILVKVHTADLHGFLDDIKQKWAASGAPIPLDYYFLDDHFATLYQAEEKTGELFFLIAGVAISIACLGLIGLVAFTTQQRAKEMSIRKVLGASVQNVLFLLSQEFLILVGIAFAIATPLAWWGMHAWLQNFAYRATLPASIFLCAGAATLFIALISMSFLAVRAALANPIQNLRNE